MENFRFIYSVGNLVLKTTEALKVFFLHCYTEIKDATVKIETGFGCLVKIETGFGCFSTQSIFYTILSLWTFLFFKPQGERLIALLWFISFPKCLIPCFVYIK